MKENEIFEIQLKGKIDFMGKEIEIIEGGFGENQRIITAKEIANIHEMELKEVNKSINRLISKGRIKENIDYMNIISQVNTLPMDLEQVFGVKPAYLSRTESIFILSERGYSKLIKSMDDDESWDVMDRLIEEYFTMRKIIQSKEQIKAQLLLSIYNGGQDGILSAKKLTEIEVEEATKPLLETIEEQKPAVTFTNTVLKSKDNILMRQLAKIACDEGINIGEKKLYKKLREWKMIMANSTEPYQKYIDNGTFVLEEKTVDTSYGVKITHTTKVTPMGQIRIIERLKEEMKQG